MVGRATPTGDALQRDRSGLLTGRDDVDDAATATGAELDVARDQREQGVVATATDARARVEVGAALADDDLAGVDQLAAVALHAKALGVGVAAVLGGRRALLVSHESFLLESLSGPGQALISVTLTWVYFWR